ncbi:GNAT family N-acetyltransferase [Paenibacillus sp. 5J-6]|uniref:GNAT family N-acetyltransferase n=1 Tax=Paenibacillus silvestris TaxID=2606219 RepID=A0A6L8US14_9BACL|nr:GNAT family N-acetyltransferase [Paenibacillus silvestris]MZQ80813.1 GNAT family N-acetyltransferase [Paenibacillus silvestris]
METNRCSINITNQADYIDLLKLYNDIKVWDYLGGQRSSQQIEDRITEWINPQENCHYWTVKELGSGAFVGSILLTPHYDGEYTQISYMFLSSFWGNGFALEAVSQVLCHSFEDKAYKKILAEAQSANTSSCALLKKLGFYEVKRVTRFDAEQVIYSIDHPSHRVVVD